MLTNQASQNKNDQLLADKPVIGLHLIRLKTNIENAIQKTTVLCEKHKSKPRLQEILSSLMRKKERIASGKVVYKQLHSIKRSIKNLSAQAEKIFNELAAENKENTESTEPSTPEKPIKFRLYNMDEAILIDHTGTPSSEKKFISPGHNSCAGLKLSAVNAKGKLLYTVIAHISSYEQRTTEHSSDKTRTLSENAVAILVRSISGMADKIKEQPLESAQLYITLYKSSQSLGTYEEAIEQFQKKSTLPSQLTIIKSNDASIHTETDRTTGETRLTKTPDAKKTATQARRSPCSRVLALKGASPGTEVNRVGTPVLFAQNSDDGLQGRGLATCLNFFDQDATPVRNTTRSVLAERADDNTPHAAGGAAAVGASALE